MRVSSISSDPIVPYYKFLVKDNNNPTKERKYEKKKITLMQKESHILVYTKENIIFASYVN